MQPMDISPGSSASRSRRSRDGRARCRIADRGRSATAHQCLATPIQNRTTFIHSFIFETHTHTRHNKQYHSTLVLYLGGEEFDFGVGIRWIDEASRMHLHLRDVGEPCADRLCHLDAVTCAMRSVRRRQTQQIGTF